METITLPAGRAYFTPIGADGTLGEEIDIGPCGPLIITAHSTGLAPPVREYLKAKFPLTFDPDRDGVAWLLRTIERRRHLLAQHKAKARRSNWRSVTAVRRRF